MARRPLAALCLTSFVARGETFELYAYEALETPRGVTLVDVATILPEASMFYYKNPDGANRGIAAFANLFRYRLLKLKGGWWVDVDVLGLDAPVPNVDLDIGWRNETRLGNSLPRATPGHFLLSELRGRAERAGSKNLQWGQTGPALLTALVEEYSLQNSVQPRWFAYPIGHVDYSMFVRRLRGALAFLRADKRER